MSNCQECDSNRIIAVRGKTTDKFTAETEDNDYEGYVPSDLGIGGGDYIKFSFCADCGQIQGEFPLDETDVELGNDESDDDEDEDNDSDDEDLQSWD